MRKILIKLIKEKDNINIYFSYKQELVDRIKLFKIRRWNPIKKCWVIPLNFFNEFKEQFQDIIILIDPKIEEYFKNILVDKEIEKEEAKE